jgi:hypothetical protein
VVTTQGSRSSAKSRPDIWQENGEKPAQAVTAYTERLTRLLADYVP